MRKLIALPFLFLAIFTFSGCKTNDPNKLLKNSDTRSQIISTLLKNAEYNNELMDSMMKQMNSAEMMHKMMGGDKMMQMMKGDTSIRNSMMGQMMEMADQDSMMCKKMMNMIMNQPNISRQLMNTQKKTGIKDTVDHSKHHPK